MLRFCARLLPLVPLASAFLIGWLEGRAQSPSTEISGSSVLPAGTSVILLLKESLYKKDAKPGQPVEFEVAYDVFVNGQVAIKIDTPVHGSIRLVNHPAKGPLQVVIDPGSVQTTAGGTVRLAPSSFSSNPSPGIGQVVGMGSEAGPILPGLVIASLFEKRVILDKDAWGGVREVVQTADSFTLDPEKLKVAQERYLADRKAAQKEFCQLLASPTLLSSERLSLLADRSGLNDSPKAELLHRAGDLDGAIEAYQQDLASGQDLPCSDTKIAEVFKPSAVDLHFQLAGVYRDKHDFVHAVAECRTALQLAPRSERVRVGLIDTLQDSGDLDTAISESDESIRLWPENPYFHYLRGSLLLKKKNADAAIGELQLALKMAKDHLSPANCELGRAFAQNGNLDGAFRQYRTAVQAHVNDEQCRHDYEQLRLQLKK